VKLPRDFVVFDTETTGMPPGARLVEIGAVAVRGHSIVERFQELIYPEQPIPPKVIEVHGIEDQHVATARTAAEVIPDFLAWIGARPVMGHNVSFDASMLANECNRLGLPLPENAAYCTLGGARNILPRRSHSLENLANEFGLEAGRAHRASDDAETTLQLLWKLEEIAGAGFRLDQLGSGAAIAHFAAHSVRLPASKQSLQEAANGRIAVDLHYRNASGFVTQTRVTPRYFYESRSRPVMEALCHMDGYYKTYRVERVIAAHPCPEAGPGQVRRPPAAPQAEQPGLW